MASAPALPPQAPAAPASASPFTEFRRSIALVVGINAYRPGIPALRSAVADATRLGDVLTQLHGFTVQRLLDSEATLEGLRHALAELAQEAQEGDRVIFYFAGHGVALDSERDGPTGFLVPQDADRDGPDTFLPMQEISQALSRLACRHLLVILDCCFAGTFRWSTTREMGSKGLTLYRQRLLRYVRQRAWQALTSAAPHQRALDVFAGVVIGDRETGRTHSPFATSLLEVLSGTPRALDSSGWRPGANGVVTATELYLYLRESLLANAPRQTPGFWPLPQHDWGEFVFRVPDQELNLPEAPARSAPNPYRGLLVYEDEQAKHFFGRDSVVEALRQRLAARRRLTVILGPSGSGKSSVVRAGLLPPLRAQGPWEVLPVVRLGTDPSGALAVALSWLPAGPDFPTRVRAWQDTQQERRLLLFIDQLEELFTTAADASRTQALEWLQAMLSDPGLAIDIIATLRTDHEAPFLAGPLKGHWAEARYVLPPMDHEELRQAIEGPASDYALYFQPASLVDRMITEVHNTPGALPLLSLALSAMYEAYRVRTSDERALTEEDYNSVGGVIGSLQHRAEEVYSAFDAHRQAVMRRCLLRMVALDGAMARRRVPKAELTTLADPEESRIATEVIKSLEESRLLVSDSQGGVEFIEPAHDALVRGWDRMWTWRREAQKVQDTLLLQQRLTQASADWSTNQKSPELLWDGDPRLQQLLELRAQDKHAFNRQEQTFIQASRALRSRKRNRLILGVAVAFLLAVGAALTFTRLWRQAEENGEQARIERDRAQRQARTSRSQALATLSTTKMQTERDLALLLAAEALHAADTPLARSSLLNILRLNPRLHTWLHGRYVGGDTLAFDARTGQFVTGDPQGELQGWDPRTGITTPLGHRHQELRKMALSPQGRWIATYGADRTVRLTDRQQGTSRIFPTAPYQGLESTLAFSPDDKQLAAVGRDKRLILWDMETGIPREGDLSSTQGFLTTLAFSPDGATLAIGGTDGFVSIWDIRAHRLVRSIESQDPPTAAIDLTFSPQGLLVSAHPSSVVQFISYDLQTLKAKEGFPYASYAPGVNTIAFSPNGKLFAYARESRDVVIQPADGSTLFQEWIEGHPAPAKALAFSADGQWLATADNAGNVLIWSLSELPPLVSRLATVQGEPARLATSSDGRLLAVAVQSPNEVLLIDTVSKQAAPLPDGPAEWPVELAFTDRDQTLSAVMHDGSLIRWDTGKRVVREALPGWQGQRPIGMTTTVEGHLRIVTVDDGEHLRLWKSETGKFELFPESPGHQPKVGQFSQDGKLLLTGGFEGGVHAWDASALTALGPLADVHLKALERIAFTRDDSRFATTGVDAFVQLWNTASRTPYGKKLQVPGALSRYTTDLAFHPDGELLASGGGNSSLFLWSSSTQSSFLAPLTVHDGGIKAVLFSPDGRTLYTAGEDHQILAWDFDPDSWKKRACRMAGRSMTDAERQQYLPGVEDPPACP